MQDVGILDLALDPRYAQLGQPARRRSPLVLLVVAALLALAAAAAFPLLQTAFSQAFAPAYKPIRISFEEMRHVAAMTVEDKSQILAKGLDAQQRNAGIPISALPMEAVAALRLGMVEGNAQATALRCLTQAVYYEAAHEPLQGRRAVAQVVLNRMRHPAYPNSVCGVVYQGSERRTGCQFSFTCDGALLRAPAVSLWREAESIAGAALAGFVEPSVGTATHYHADYVLPKWAFQLGKITQLGRHIFYRFNGNWGRSQAFNARYSGVERLPMVDYAALRLKLGSDALLAAAPVPVEGLTVAPEVTDRHAPSDVGGRLDVTKAWRLTIPDPVAASPRYRAATEAVGSDAPAAKPGLAAADPTQAALVQ